MSETLKNTYEEVPFLAKLRLEAYSFNKKELLRRNFSNNFTLLFVFRIYRAPIMQCTSHQWMLLNKSSNRTYIYLNSELGFSFIQIQQYLQGLFDI